MKLFENELKLFDLFIIDLKDEIRDELKYLFSLTELNKIKDEIKK